MDKYRKLTKEELHAYGVIKTDNVGDRTFRDFAKKYYPSNAALIEVVLHSEYNDNTYDNSITYVGVYDKDGNELVPSKENREAARKAMRFLHLQNDNTHNEVSSFFVRVDTTVPDLYIKES